MDIKKSYAISLTNIRSLVYIQDLIDLLEFNLMSSKQLGTIDIRRCLKQVLKSWSKCALRNKGINHRRLWYQ